MGELTICMTPEQIKDLLGLCSENICPDECPCHGALYCENALMKEALVYIMQLEEQLDKARLVQDCSTCGEEYRDLHFYPCCACEPAPPTRMSKWHPKGTKAPPVEIPQHVIKEEEKRRRREWEEFMREDT